MTDARQILVLWDIDRTLLYVGDIDRQVYRETFAEIVGRPAERLPARGTGVTMPLAIRSLLLDNGVPEADVPGLVPRMVELLPQRLAAHADDLREQGVLLPGAVDALKAVHAQPGCVPTVVTGNLKPNALLKLEAFHLDGFLDTEIGGYSSDDDHRPALVSVAQERAQAKYGTTAFSRADTVIIGDSLEDVRTGLEGGAPVIGVASGKTTAAELSTAGADVVLDSLEDVPRLLDAIVKATLGRA
ncbi:haloacid dehalogenase-like hydrolase [Streptomyces sp. NPDC002838]|uniref:HAD family hydrolase n=1 Tax=Streptomyces sp. NPDC002838 TaxID=3154436 RepID=UPI003332D7B0